MPALQRYGTPLSPLVSSEPGRSSPGHRGSEGRDRQRVEQRASAAVGQGSHLAPRWNQPEVRRGGCVWYFITCLSPADVDGK